MRCKAFAKTHPYSTTNKYTNKMKKIFLLPVLLIIAVLPAFSQKYTTAADTPALNKEYAKVSSNIADLTTRLGEAQSDLAKYNRKSDKASSDAQSTAATTANKASHATNGDVRDARRAKKEARRSVKDAKDSRKADNNVDDQNKKVRQLTAELAKNKARLQELETMRATISY
jgi:DNA repair exonuclease SbcCD ATPase subunit